jgi:hypothetical protein
MITVATATAQPVHVYQDPGAWWTGHFVYYTPTRYTAQELSLDLFGTYMHAENKIEDIFKTSIKHGTWGGGVGLNYFIIRNIGLGADINMPDNRGNLVDSVLGNLIVRFPIADSGWAPYLFGGGGRGTEPAWEWLGQAGVGCEYRWNPMTGIFVDSRYVWADKSFDRLLFRAGLRFVF